VAELTGYRFDPLEVTATAPGEPLTHALVLTGSFYPNAEEAIRELKEEGWRNLGAVSVRLFNPFPEEELAEVLVQSQVVTILDRSNSFGSVPPLASRVMSALARRREMPPSFRTVVGGLGGREITVAQLKELMKFSFLMLSPAPQSEPRLRKQLIDSDPVLQGMLTELAALEERSMERHTRMAKPSLSMFTSPARPANFREKLTLDLIVGNYARILANYGPVEFLEARELWGESRLIKKLLIRLEMLLARKLAEQGRLTFRGAITLLEYGVEPGDLRQALAGLEKIIQAAPPDDAWVMYGLAQGYRSKYEALGLTLTPPHYPAQPAPPVTPSAAAPQEDHEPHPKPPEVAFSDAEASRLREAIRRLAAETAYCETLLNPEDMERRALELVAQDPDSELARFPGEDFRQAYRNTYTGVIDRALLEEILMQHYAPELREIFSGDGLSALNLVIQAAMAFFLHHSDNKPSSPEEVNRQTALEVERYLREEVYPKFPRTPGFYHDFYKALVAPEIRQTIAREAAGRG
jgi:hypothetical protein